MVQLNCVDCILKHDSSRRSLILVASRQSSLQIGAAMRVRSALAFATHQFFQQAGFQYLHTPIISAADCEGAGELFQVKPWNYFSKSSLIAQQQSNASRVSIVCKSLAGRLTRTVSSLKFQRCWLQITTLSSTTMSNYNPRLHFERSVNTSSLSCFIMRESRRPTVDSF